MSVGGTPNLRVPSLLVYQYNLGRPSGYVTYPFLTKKLVPLNSSVASKSLTSIACRQLLAAELHTANQLLIGWLQARVQVGPRGTVDSSERYSIIDLMRETPNQRRFGARDFISTPCVSAKERKFVHIHLISSKASWGHTFCELLELSGFLDRIMLS